MTQTEGPPPATDEAAQPPVVVKKYANRRLYNTESSSYITLDNLADMVRAGRDFVVYDARSGDDITRSVLTQIIVEEESKGRALLPTTFLRQLIGFYGDSLGGIVPRYLEHTMSAIARQQEQMRQAMQHTMGNLLPPGLEEMRRQNIAMMERAMSLFSPFYRPPEADAPAAGPQPEAADPASLSQHQILALQREVEELRILLAARHAQAAAASPAPQSPTTQAAPAPQAAPTPSPTPAPSAAAPAAAAAARARRKPDDPQS
jgi:polyhydroxyalkanoate synthesis repressor PhaR